jgi:hypothetical protein
MIHLGNFLDLDQLLIQYLPVLVGETMCGNGPGDPNVWKMRFDEFENEIRERYRLAFTSSPRYFLSDPPPHPSPTSL